MNPFTKFRLDRCPDALKRRENKPNRNVQGYMTF